MVGKIWEWREIDGKKRLVKVGSYKSLFNVDWKSLLVVVIIVLSYVMVSEYRAIALDPCGHCSCCDALKGVYSDNVFIGGVPFNISFVNGSSDNVVGGLLSGGVD